MPKDFDDFIEGVDVFDDAFFNRELVEDKLAELKNAGFNGSEALVAALHAETKVFIVNLLRAYHEWLTSA